MSEKQVDKLTRQNGVVIIAHGVLATLYNLAQQIIRAEQLSSIS